MFLANLSELSHSKSKTKFVHNPFEIFHDPLPGRDPSVEKRWSISLFYPVEIERHIAKKLLIRPV